MRAILFSAELASLPRDVNAQRTRDLARLLHSFKVSYRKALGRYHGTDETSFLVTVTPETADETLRLALELANRFEQEAILEVNETQGTLRDKSGAPIGSLALVSESLESQRPESDHTAIETRGGYLILKFA